MDSKLPTSLESSTVFIAGAGYSMAVYFSISLNMLQFKTDDEEFSLPDFPEASKVERTQMGNDLKFTDGTDSWYLLRVHQFSLCLCSDAILLNTIEGLGEIGVKYFSRKMGGKPVWMVGPACSTVMKNGYKKEDIPAAGRLSSDVASCSDWLNLHPPASVLYVSFGSQNTIPPSQMMELAMGLEASGVAFIWVIRPPLGFSVTEELRPEWFPDGFQERIRKKNQGILVRQWAPQLEILSHESTGAFLSHCGWNSVLESLSEGVPIIGWPVGADQFFNSQILENDAGVSIEIARGTNSAVVGHDHIATVIKMVTGKTEKGKEMRRKAGEIKEKMAEAIRDEEGFKGASVKAMDEFLSAAIMASKRSLPCIAGDSN